MGIVRAAFWVPATFIVAAALAGLMGVRLSIRAMRARGRRRMRRWLAQAAGNRPPVRRPVHQRRVTP
jgi:hypothetical protein